MKKNVEIKLRQDDFSNRFANGLTMTCSKSSNELQVTEKTQSMTIYKNLHGHTLQAHHKKLKNATKYYNTFINTSDETATIDMLSSFAFTQVACTKIHRFQSFWSAEGKLKSETLIDLHLEPSWSGYGMRVEKFGQLGSMPVRKWVPLLILEDEVTKKFCGIQLYGASSWQMELTCIDEHLSISGGLADSDFGHWFKTLSPGESFTTPIAMVANGTSINDVCDKLVKSQKLDIVKVDENLPIMFNEFCATWGNPTEKKMKQMVDALAEKGFTYFVIDAGWYMDDILGWETTIGDWLVNKKLFPNGLKAIVDYIKEKGMIAGLWFEMEILGRNSTVFNDTTHVLKRNGIPITTGDRRFWDMSDMWVIDYLSEKIIKLLTDCGFGYLKIDYNDNIGVGCDGAESLGEGLRQKVLASQEFFKKIRKDIPDLVIESCCSGGHRLEPSMLELVSQASFSDAHECLSIPIIAANIQRFVSPKQSQIWAVVRKTDSIERLYYSMISTFLGRMCISGDVLNLSEHQWDVIKDGITFYDSIKEILKYGSTIINYNTTESYNNPVGHQVVLRKYNNQALLLVHAFSENENINLSILNHYNIIKEYGTDLSKSLSAKALLLEINKQYT